MSTKNILQAKLSDHLLELRFRSKDSSLAVLQRLFGICLGLRLALIELNLNEDLEPQDFNHADLMFDLITRGMDRLIEWRKYKWPGDV